MKEGAALKPDAETSTLQCMSCQLMDKDSSKHVLSLSVGFVVTVYFCNYAHHLLLHRTPCDATQAAGTVTTLGAD